MGSGIPGISISGFRTDRQTSRPLIVSKAQSTLARASPDAATKCLGMVWGLQGPRATSQHSWVQTKRLWPSGAQPWNSISSQGHTTEPGLFHAFIQMQFIKSFLAWFSSSSVVCLMLFTKMQPQSNVTKKTMTWILRRNYSVAPKNRNF